MSTDPQGTNVSVIVGIHADSRPEVTAGVGELRRIHVAHDGHDVAFVGSPDDMLAYARALVTAVEAAVPVDLLMADWEKDAEEAVQT